MSCGGPLSSVMMIAGAGMLPGAGAIAGIGASLGVPASLTGALGSFTSLPITSAFSDVVSGASGVLGGGVLDSLRTLGADVFPALTNAIPGGFAGALSVATGGLPGMAAGGVFDGGFTGLISGAASNIMGGGDLTKFSQIFSAGEGLLGQANQFINSNINISNIASTFGPITGGMDSLMTGAFSQVSEAFGSLGGDLGQLGNLIDMKNLDNLGSPAALVKQLADVGGLVPGVSNVLKESGLNVSQISSLVSGNLGGLTDSANKLLYEGMTQITGGELDQVKNILGVTTPNIGTMADLLNPAKILPNSFPTLTMPTPDGLRGIYTDATGTVNTNLEKFLTNPTPTVTTINPDLISRARQATALAGRTNQTFDARTRIIRT